MPLYSIWQIEKLKLCLVCCFCDVLTVLHILPSVHWCCQLCIRRSSGL